MAVAVGPANSKSYRIEGNTRTQSFYIQRLVRNCEKDSDIEDSSQLAEGIEQCLLNSKLFSEVNIEVTENETRVRVEEKWTLVPLPYLAVSSTGDKAFGAFLLESNFLGVGATLGLGGIYSSRGKRFFLYLSDRTLFSDAIGGALGLRQEAIDVKLFDANQMKDAFHELSREGGFALSFRPGNFYYAVTLSRLTTKYGSFENYVKPGDNASTRALVEARYSKTAYRIFYNEGYTIQGSVLQELDKNDNSQLYSLIDVRALTEFPAFGSHAVHTLLRAGSFLNGKKNEAPRFGSDRGFRGFERFSIWAKQYATAAINYHVPVLDSIAGILTLGPFLDTGHFTLMKDAGSSDFYSVGIGTYYYLKQVALPGFGIEFGRNSKRKAWFSNLSLGIAF